MVRTTCRTHTCSLPPWFVSADEPDASALELPGTVLAQLQAEALLMSRLRHPNVARLMGLCLLPPAIISEFYARGSLFDVLRNAASDPAAAALLTWRLRLRMAADAATGLLCE